MRKGCWLSEPAALSGFIVGAKNAKYGTGC